MARLRSLIARAPGGARRSGGNGSYYRRLGFAALAAALLLPAGFGCSTLGKTKSEVAIALHLEKPQQATQMICFWQRRPQHLPDPTRDGVLAPGLVGQLFLLSPDQKAVEITGDLIVQAVDETKRPPGQPAATPEIWHIDKVALRKLATKDERFGTCYALFLPWPANWKDVTNVRMQAKYTNKPHADLFAADVAMTLEFSAPGVAVWNDPNSPNPAARVTGPSEMRGIPDITNALKGQQSRSFAPPIQQASTNPPMGFTPGAFPPAAANPAPMGFPPPAAAGPGGAPAETTSRGPDGSIITTKVWTSPPPPANFAPTVTPPPLPVQQTNFGQQPPLPIQQPDYAQPLPPAIPLSQPGPNGGLPPLAVPPSNGSLQPIVIPRY